MTSVVKAKYGILKRNVELREYYKSGDQKPKHENTPPPLTLKVIAGTLLKIIPNANFGKKSSSLPPLNGIVPVQIIDYIHEDCRFEKLYECTHRYIHKVRDDQWPYVISIAEASYRLKFCLGQQIECIPYFNLHTLVVVDGVSFDQLYPYYCHIRYIGPVHELYPVGYFFGLQMMDEDSRVSPQINDVSFAYTYTNCEPARSLFVTANCLSVVPSEYTKKATPLDIISETFERVRTAFGPATNCLGRTVSHDYEEVGTSTDSIRITTADVADNVQPYGKIGDDQEWQIILKKRKGSKPKKPTAQFYADTPSSSLSKNVEAKNRDKRNSKTMDRKINAIDKDLITTNTDDFKQAVENYDTNLERQHHGEGIGGGGGSVNAEIFPLPPPNTLASFVPHSILKNRNTNHASTVPVSSAAVTTAAVSSGAVKKPSTILSLKDRDIVVIDQSDIHQAVKDEGAVIVVKDVNNLSGGTNSGNRSNTTGVDIIQLLGQNWPNGAGDVGAILNKKYPDGNYSNSLPRNKSPNVLKHLSSGHNINSNNNNNTNNNNTSNNNGNTSHNNNNNNNSAVNAISGYSSTTSRRKTNNDRKAKYSGTTGATTNGHSEAGQQRLHTEGNVVTSRASASLKQYENQINMRRTHRTSLSSSSPPLYDNLNLNFTHVDNAGGSSASQPSSTLSDDFIEAGSPLAEVPNNPTLGVGSMVEVTPNVDEKLENIYGVIRWIGMPPDAKKILVGIELEEDYGEKLQTTNGSYQGVRLFRCQSGRALFVPPEQCMSDRRFNDCGGSGSAAIGFDSNSLRNDDEGGSVSGAGVVGAKTLNGNCQQNDTNMFGHVECPPVPGAVAPLKMFNIEALQSICGQFKGIQGHHNSCYLDATLFSMFTFTSVFDSLLFRPPGENDIPNYNEVQKVLREEIVNPLRKNIFVRADRVMKLRKLLDKLSSVSGLTSEEKDPEEFLNSLLAQIMHVEPFLKLSSGQDAYFYQLFVEKDERLAFPTVQQLFEQSFHSSDIKLKEVPSCLIIQMPRFGKNFKMYPRILPSQMLDVTDIIEDSPRQCSVCGKLAEYECRDCFGNLQDTVDLESTAFCYTCLETVHKHAKRSNHKSKPISVPSDFRIMAEHINTVPRVFMELFAVVCIETSHYVAFVKAGLGPDAPWCFFDSMADRKGERNGYNIPEMIAVPELPQWLSEEGARNINASSTNDKLLQEHAKRLFCDAYMCMYQSTDVMMYR